MTLLWISLIAGVIVSALEVDSSAFDETDGFMWWFVVVMLLTYALFGALIVFVWRRHNWARILVLVLTVVGVIVMLIPWPGIDDEYWTVSTAASQIGFLILDGVALFWLFTGAGAGWFAQRGREAF